MYIVHWPVPSVKYDTLHTLIRTSDFPALKSASGGGRSRRILLVGETEKSNDKLMPILQWMQRLRIMLCGQ